MFMHWQLCRGVAVSKHKSIPMDEILKIDYFKGWYPQWVQNNRRNWQTVYGDFRRGNACVACIPKVTDTPAIIVGSGPSLDVALPILKDWKHAIFSGPTNALAIEAHGAHPTYIHAYDSHKQNAKRLNYKWDYSKTELIIHPSSHPDNLNAWRGRRWYFLRHFPGHDFFEYLQPMGWGYIYKERGIDIIFPFRGCVVNNEVAIAAYLGYNPLFVVGVDFGWKDPEKTRHTTHVQNKRGGLEPLHIPTEEELGKVQINISPNGTHYVGKDNNFHRHFLDLIGPLPVDVFDCSDGMISELKKADIKEVIAKQGEGFRYSPQEKGEMRKKIIDILRRKDEKTISIDADNTGDSDSGRG